MRASDCAGGDAGDWYLIGVRRPRLVLALALGCVFLLAAGAQRLSFDPRYGTFFDADDPQLVAFEHLRSVFTPSDAVVFVVDAGGEGVFSREGLIALETLTEQGWLLPFARRVDALTNHPHSVADGDLVTIAPLAEGAAGLDAEARAGIREVALASPEIVGRLVDAEGRRAAVAVTVLLEGDPLTATTSVVDAARAVAAEVEAAHAGVSVHVGGIVAMNHAFAESSLTDSATLMPLMFGLILVGLVWLLASVLRMLTILLVVVLSVLGALGAAGWLGIVLTTPTAVAPIIILTIAVAHGVHLVLGQYAGAENPAWDHAAGLRASLADNWMPVLLTTATSAAGFLSLNFSAVPPFRDLGNVVAIGVLLGGALSLTALPALLRLLPASARLPRLRGSVFRGFADFVVARRRLLLLGTGLALLLVLPGLTRLRINDDFVAYFDPALPFRTAAEITDAHLGGMYEIEQQLTATDGSIHDPLFLAEVAAYTRWLREQPETGHVLAWTDVLARLHRTVGDAEPEGVPAPDTGAMAAQAAGVLPADASTAAQYTLLFELSLPLGLDVTNVIASDYASVRHLVALRDMDARAVVDFEARAVAWLAANAPHVEERRGGINLMFAHISERNARAMFTGNVLAVVLIAFMLLFALRSVLLASASLATNLVPIAAAFGLWAWAGGEIGLALSSTFGMTLGIVVDDTVHLLARQRRARRAGAGPVAAVHAALVGAGPAIVVTTVVLLAGFAALASSTFALNGMLASITLLTIALALLFDLLALPGLLAWHEAPAAGDAGPADDRGGAPG